MWERSLCTIVVLFGCSNGKMGVDLGPNSSNDAGAADSQVSEADTSVSSVDTGLPTRDVSTPDPTCADVHLTATPVTPTVMLIVDQSSSMTWGFGSGTRWGALKDSLLADSTGLISELQSNVKFGLAMYSSRDSDDDGRIDEGSVCPMLTTVAPAMNNFDAIAATYGPANVIDETPTGDSINAVLDSLEVDADSDETTVFIVATDGEPDTCSVPNPKTGQDEAIAAVTRAFGSGVRSYILSVGSDISTGHLQDMANAGVGMASGETAPYWVAGGDTGLRDALREIIGNTLSCEVELEGTLDPAMACSGLVTLNGMPLVCDDPNGWQVVDNNTIRLLGNACDAASHGPAILDASFPCDVAIY